ncbi:unnamed protein product [Adineta steineri]|uniref:RRM domain-containing protein n=1 Tax=Adineta steineri TaxID=433720 RepID=A0A819KXG1_9BILA|nr:unnamed protein product [Adineta steineri]CAF3953381.1 unnamed protein product [Adineta steineri]
MEDVDATEINHHQLSSLLIVSSVQNQNEENNCQGETQIDRYNKFQTTTNEDSFLTTLTESESEKYLSELLQVLEEQFPPTDTLMDATKNMFDDIETSNEQFPSSEHLINTLDTTSLATLSISMQNEDLTDRVDVYQEKVLNSSSSPSISTNPTTSNISVKNNIKKRKIGPIENLERTLVVTGLRENINEINLSNHFLQSIQVTIKQCQTSSLKYAFILHKTKEEAKSNLLKPINYILLGSQCHVEYAHNSSFIPLDHQSDDKQTIVITNIPENVSEDDLRHLFPDSRISKYCPSRSIHRKPISIDIPGKIKILWGYAFLSYDNVQQAANVIEHAQQYQINGQSLRVSFRSKEN